MLTFFLRENKDVVYAVQSQKELDNIAIEKFKWLFDFCTIITTSKVTGTFIGPRKEMITPWSTNAVDITVNMGLSGIQRIEKFRAKTENIDPMLEVEYVDLLPDMFDQQNAPEPIKFIDNISDYNEKQGLALNKEEIQFLKNISRKMSRKLTDSEIFGFSQVNSEHCRHKIFNGKFIIDGQEQKNSLFKLIKETSKANHNEIVSAYKDNVAFINGPEIDFFYPEDGFKSSFFKERKDESVISLKAETHNFPTTVEPFFGAATGSGGEIRDRMAGGKGSMPLVGTAVYMTSKPELEKQENSKKRREFLYQTPEQILIKASNGASDFGNKFGQPLINGSLFTYEHFENENLTAYDKVIMLAGGIGFGVKSYAFKDLPKKDDLIVLLGGDNYRIGMGGGAVSSVDTGKYGNKIELNAVQRANPEMQKRVYNVVRALAESENNPIISIHDHGAGGHLNCFSELIENTGGVIYIDKLPKGDPTLSDMEIIGNESQERMGLVVDKKSVEKIEKIAKRERAPMFVVGEVKSNNRFIFKGEDGREPFNLKLDYLLGCTPQTVLEDKRVKNEYSEPECSLKDFDIYLNKVLSNDAVACKDWLTNKVDRSVTGKVALQQTCGEFQLPLNNLGIAALDYSSYLGVATAIGHAPIPSLINVGAGSRLSVAEALTNIVWAPLKNGIKGVSLSANWMWPCKNEGEDARLYDAVESLSNFCIALGINVPTGKDSLSMTQKYPDGKTVKAPGTVIVSAAAQVQDFTKAVTPVLVEDYDSTIIYIEFSKCPYSLGGSIFYQTLDAVGKNTPDVNDPAYFAKAFNAVQSLIEKKQILAGHDISAGGMITSLLEMTFANSKVGLDINLGNIEEKDILSILFSEKPGVLIQVKDTKEVVDFLFGKSISFYPIGGVINERVLKIIKHTRYEHFDIDKLRDVWYRKSYLFDCLQTNKEQAELRFKNYAKQPLKYIFPKTIENVFPKTSKRSINAAIIREKGVNGDREMAYSLYLAGMNVKDIHMTDLMNGSEDLSDVNMLVYVGGFSNSDVLGSAKGWAAGFLFNEKAKKALDNFYKREDTLSLGVCNGCQLMVELGIFNEKNIVNPKMNWNKSGKFESSFVSVKIMPNESVMLGSLSNTELGVWIAHGEGRFTLGDREMDYAIPMKYAYSEYPANPNGSDFDAAAICTKDGRHIAMMPHIERSIFLWQWPYTNKNSENMISPWLNAFKSAYNWIEKNKK